MSVAQCVTRNKGRGAGAGAVDEALGQGWELKMGAFRVWRHVVWELSVLGCSVFSTKVALVVEGR